MKPKRILSFFIAITMCISAFPLHISAVSYNDIEFTALDGTENNGSEQKYSKLLDGTTNTKWCVKFKDDDGNTYTPYIVFKASKEVVITDYTFVTGNDNATWTGRNPKNWVLYGCNDYNESSKTGGSWTAIHTVTDDTVMKDLNYTPYKFSIDGNSAMYKYYKLEITANHGATYNLMQLSELKIDCTTIYNVTFDKNGGDTESSPQTIQSGKGLPSVNPTRNGYKFIGWYTKDGTGEDWGEEFTAESTSSEDITVYAKWERVYLVTFDLNGGAAKTTIGPIYHGNPIPTEIPTKADFQFGGWFTKNGTETGDWGEQYTLNTVVAEDITVYAKWNTVNIMFDKNGGDTDSNPNTIASGETLPTVNPTRNGYKFIGWYTKNGNDDGSWGEKFTQEMSDAATEDMTVYAKWEITTITFYTNNEEAEENSTRLNYGGTPETNPTMPGFTFEGWYTKNGMQTGDWGEKYPDIAKIYDDTTVYAKWKANGADCLANVTLTALSGTAGNSGENYDKLVDGKKIAGDFSKWCVNSTSAEVILKASAYTIPIGYTLTTGNDTDRYPGRNPKDWVLYACNDYDEENKTGSWTMIHSVTNDELMGAKSFKSYDFAVNNTKAYKYFKFEILSIKDGNTMQLGEFELKGKGCEHIFGTPKTISATCTVSGKKTYVCSNCNISTAIDITAAMGHKPGENGICSVCGESCNVKVGDNYYFDLQEAVNEALSANATVTMIRNVNITDTLNIGSGTVTLDLHGRTINMTGDGSIIKLSDNTDFTLEDNSTEKTGKITRSSGSVTDGGGIYIDSGTMTMKGGTIQACTARYGGGIYKNGGILKIEGGTITNCSATAGGGIYNKGGGLTLSGGTITSCEATGGNIGTIEAGGGGGIYVNDGQLVMSGGTITNCITTGYYFGYGGAIKSLSYSTLEINGGTISNCRSNNTIGGGIVARCLNITNGAITNCYAYKSGGGISISVGFTATISGGTISDNTTSTESAISIGGGICNYGTLNITGGEIKNNTVKRNGGGIWNFGSLTISGGTISGNSSSDGGGLYNCGTLNITAGEIKNNIASGKGGGICAEDTGDTEDTSGNISNGNLTMSGGTIFGNTAVSGGGICFNNSTNGTISGGTISGNTSTSRNSGGGGILFCNSSGTISGITVSENTSNGSMPYGGGGIMFDNSNVTVSNCLIKGNNGSDFGGGILAINSSEINIENTQITENKAFGGGGVAAQTSSKVTVNGGKIFKNNANRGCGLRIDVAVVDLNGSVEISENGSADGIYNDSNIYGAGIWASESTINFNDANVINNNAQKGGGVYIYDNSVFLNLYKGNIKGNTATVEGGGIDCKTDEITIKGGIQITGNKFVSGTTQIENNVYLKNGTTIQVENPITTDESGNYTDAKIGVTVESGYSNVVAANNTDYKKYFTPDSEKGKLEYSSLYKIVKISGLCTVVFDCGNENTFKEYVTRNAAVAEPTSAPTRDGYYFGGWYIGGTPYDFTDSISKDTIITAKWLETDKFDISITSSKIYIVSGNTNAKAYGAAYRGTQLIDVETTDVVNYAVINLNELTLNLADADTISLFVWDENLSPLCNKISLSMP